MTNLCRCCEDTFWQAYKQHLPLGTDYLQTNIPTLCNQGRREKRNIAAARKESNIRSNPCPLCTAAVQGGGSLSRGHMHRAGEGVLTPGVSLEPGVIPVGCATFTRWHSV
ncbi:unnamed protein product [Ixodes persulcatus]